jgi:hypothetical protein
VDVGSAANISEVHTASIFRFLVRRMDWGLCIHKFWSKRPTMGKNWGIVPVHYQYRQWRGKYYKKCPTDGFTVPTRPNQTLSPTFPHVSVGPKPTLYKCKQSTTLPTFTMKMEAACTSNTLEALLTYTKCGDPITASTLKTNDHKSLKLVTSGFRTEIHTWPVVRPSSQVD